MLKRLALFWHPTWQENCRV